MENKKDLAKIALAALILASTLPANAQGDDQEETTGSFLAAGCPAHGCKSGPSPSNAGEGNQTPKSTYPIGSNNQSEDGYYDPRKYNVRYPESYNSPAGSYSNINSVYSGSSSINGYQSQQNRTSSSVNEGNDNFNYNTPSKDSGLTNDNTSSNDENHKPGVSVVTSPNTLSEAQILELLTPQGKAIYLSLDPEGKELALKLANQDIYRDKNLAIKEAERRMNDRRGSFNR